ncbi:MAG TPA: SRPBCC domain-containing protein [Terriglobales bacterium]|nr:SRPBCC domain-containing protein [Terriglobales bacterium]
MTATTPISLDNHTLTIEEEIRVKASLETTFAALLEQLGPAFTAPDGASLRAKVEAFPGGRWYRDLGDNNGHFWANVQAIKRPTLLELCGPLMLSFPATHNVQYRLSHENGVTTIKFHHYGFGSIPEGARTGMPDGWTMIHDRVKQQAEAARK